ncbi:MAG: TrkA family potassium uptake protein [Caldilineae bacterium]|nr:MAG: TrkA family potassium uptake protein [Caldilineae bacterium]
MAKTLYIIIVGCGRLGSLLANRLSSMGHSVVVIDRNEAAFSKLTAEFSGFQLVGDAVELDVLRQAKIRQADCLLATTKEDNVNLMVAQVARTIFHVPAVIARVFDPSREAIYREFGVTTISPTLLAADLFLHTIEREAQR